MSITTQPISPHARTSFRENSPLPNIPHVNDDESEAYSTTNIFALLRKLAALLQQQATTHYQHKALQSLYQLHLNINNAIAIRDTGKYRNAMGYIKFGSMLTGIGGGVAAGRIGVGAQQPWNAPHIATTISQGLEGLLSILPQTRIANNDASTKERDAYIQSTHTTLDNLSKQLDQISQMIREINVQTIKDINASHHQALGSMIRA